MVVLLLIGYDWLPLSNIMVTNPERPLVSHTLTNQKRADQHKDTRVSNQPVSNEIVME